MSAPTDQTVSVCLSDAELRRLEQYAQAQGLSLEQAATRAVSQQLAVRYVKPRATGIVMRFAK